MFCVRVKAVNAGLIFPGRQRKALLSTTLPSLVRRSSAADILRRVRARAETTPSPPLPLNNIAQLGQAVIPSTTTSSLLTDHPTGYQVHLAQIPVRLPPTSSTSIITSPSDPAYAILAQPGLMIGRQLEMLNVLVGFEQANKYSIKGMSGADLGYIAEEEGTLTGAISRQLFRNNRPFKATVLDLEGRAALRLERPFTFINSCVTVCDAEGREIGQVRQVWHLWRRKYELFVAKKQFAEINTEFLGWDFRIINQKEQVLSAVNRNFTGFAREIFTDTGSYAVYMDALPEGEVARPLSLDERAVCLAAAICIDMDYFSRHSHGVSGGLWGAGDEFFSPSGMGGGWFGGSSSQGNAAPPLDDSAIQGIEKESSWGSDLFDLFDDK